VSEYGIIAPVGIAYLRKAIPMWLEDFDNGLTFDFRALLQTLQEDLILADERIDLLTAQIKNAIAVHPVGRRLMAVIGIGPLVCSAKVTQQIEFIAGQQPSITLTVGKATVSFPAATPATYLAQ